MNGLQLIFGDSSLRHQKFLLIAASTAALTVSQSAMAAGFAVSAQSAYGMGNAYAGNAAVASDASTVLTNPAGIFELDKPVLGVNVAITSTGVDFADKGSRTSPLFNADPVSVSGDGSTSLSSANPSPGLYYARKLNDQWALGFGLNVPFATESSYEDNWVGRYHAVETEVTAIDINPTIAFRINDKVSIGGGISIQRATGRLTNKLDSGATCALIYFQNGVPPAACAAEPPNGPALVPNDATRDSTVELDGDSTEITFNIGALFKPKEGTKIGVAYRHGSQHNLKGNTKFILDPGLAALIRPPGEDPVAPGPRFLDNSASALSADLPATLDLSIAQMVHEKVELLGTLKWTQWTSFDVLTTTFDNPEQNDTALPFAWEDTVTASAGFNYEVNNKLTMRAGFLYDQSPVPNPRARSPRGAANDRYWYSVGGTYSFSSKISINFAATHIQIDQSAIDNTGETTGSPTLRGTYDFDVNLIAFQFNWHFI